MEAAAADNNGITGSVSATIKAAAPKPKDADAWEDKIHRALLSEGEIAKVDVNDAIVIPLKRLERTLTFEGDGKIITRYSKMEDWRLTAIGLAMVKCMRSGNRTKPGYSPKRDLSCSESPKISGWLAILRKWRNEYRLVL